MSDHSIIITGLNGRPIELAMSAEDVKVDQEDQSYTITARQVRMAKASNITAHERERGVIETIAGIDIEEKQKEMLRQSLGKIFAVYLKPRDPKKGHKMATYVSSVGSRFEEEQGGVPKTLKLISDAKEAVELQEISQFDITKIEIMDTTPESQFLLLKSQLDRLMGEMYLEDETINTLDNLADTAEMYCRMLRNEADEIEERANRARETLISKIKAGDPAEEEAWGTSREQNQEHTK